MVHMKEGVSAAVAALEQLYDAQTGVDVTFQLSDGQLQAHKCFLIARLPYFRAMFESGMIEATTCIVDIGDCDRQTFDGLVE